MIATAPAPETEYTNLANGSVLRVVDADDMGRATVVTVTASGRIANQRTVATTGFHEGYLTRQGKPRKTGWVRTDELPYTHEYAPQNKASEAVAPDVTKMDDTELFAYIERKETERDLAKQEAETAKKELAERTTKEGTRILGDVAVVARPNRRFDAKLARQFLSPVQYASICESKPSPEKARNAFGKESELYTSMTKDHGWTLTVRMATDDDRDHAAADAALANQARVQFKLGGPLPEEDLEPPF